MIATFTRDDIVRYVYLETSEEENYLIEQTLLTEPDLQQFYEDVLEMKVDLDHVIVGPSYETVQNILVYSRNFPTARVAH